MPLRKPKTKGIPNFNGLRDVLRQAMNNTKNLEVHREIAVAKCAIWQWNELDKIFKKLGGYV